MPIDQNQLQTLNAHERNKRVSEIPQFYGVPSKDTVSARQLIVRIEQAALICSWNDEAKALQLACALKERCATWFDGLPSGYYIDQKNWTDVKDIFLKTYDDQVTAQALSVSLKELSQQPGERILDYNYRSQVIFNKYYDQFMPICKDTASPHEPDYMTAADNAQKTRYIEQRHFAAQRMLIQMQMSLYEAGLLEIYRLEVSQKTYANMKELHQAALASEARRSTKRGLVHSLATGEADPEFEDEAEDLDADLYDQLNAVYVSKGKRMPQNYRRRAPAARRTGTPTTLTAEQKKLLTCFHCGIKGHVIGECRKKKNGLPKAKHLQGQPRNKVNEVDASDAASQQQLNEVRVSSIRIPSLTESLNF